jgi:colanic acid biosynthesis glycosyl transferase WcaI
MAKVAFLSLVFPPDSVSTSQIMGELASGLKGYGHDVTVMTTTPHYNRDIEMEAVQPLYRFWGRLIQKSDFRGIPVFHVLIPRKSKKILARFLPWLSFHFLNIIAGAFVLPKPDIFIVPSPPLTMGINAWVLSRLLKSRYVYNVQEIYPDYAISMGAIRNKVLIRLLYKLESFTYAKAAAVTVIAPNMGKQLALKGVPNNKLVIIPNFADEDIMSPLPKDNHFSRQFGVYNKFMISYAGNMGVGQDLEKFIECAALLQDHKNIHFMMMGDGMLRDELKERVNNLGLTNFTFLEYQPYSLVPQIYAASDLCLVPQSKKVTDVAIPSKVYRIMACSRPVLASTVPNSDLAELVKTVKCGFVVDAGSVEQLCETILFASQNQETLVEMGKGGYKHVHENYSRKAIARQYHELIQSLTHQG